LFVLTVLAAAAGGCVSSSNPRGEVAAGEGAPAQAADLDSLVYGRRVDQRAVTARAHAPVAAVRPVSAPGVPGMSTLGHEEPPYALDTGDRLRVVVFGQDGLSNSYAVDASGAITMPLIKSVAARGLTTDQLARAVAERLRRGYVREPHVAIEIEAYRPFFILGEVTAPGQYAYVPRMTVESAVAIAGGFTPRAYRYDIRIDRPVAGGVMRMSVPPVARVWPGDTVVVTERWF